MSNTSYELARKLKKPLIGNLSARANSWGVNRTQILWLQSWIAFSGVVFWLWTPELPHTPYVVTASMLWGVLGLVSIFVESLEVWTYRLSAFLGFLLGTIEGIVGLLGLVEKPGLLPMALLHGSTFALAVVGKYLSQSRSRAKFRSERMDEALKP